MIGANPYRQDGRDGYNHHGPGSGFAGLEALEARELLAADPPADTVKIGQVAIDAGTFDAVQSKDLQGNTLSLAEGLTYKLKASGAVRFVTQNGIPYHADAEFAYADKTTSPDIRKQKTLVDYGIAIDDDTPPTIPNNSNGSPGPEYQKPNRWTALGNPKDPDHEYVADYIGTGAPATFFFLDDHYGDNSGTLTVEIFQQVKGNLTAYRPRLNTVQYSDYGMFGKIALPDQHDTDHALGPGLRLNGLQDEDLHGEDDLVEIDIRDVLDDNASVQLQRGTPNLRVFLDPLGEEELPFTDNTSALLEIGVTDPPPLDVAWDSDKHGTGQLDLIDDASSFVLDSIRFHTFQSIVVGIGGFTQGDAMETGTGVAAKRLYEEGYDAWWFTHLDSNDATSQITIAASDRGVQNVGMWGYSLGGGDVRDVASGLTSGGIGGLIRYTAYVDAINVVLGFPFAETRKPPSSPVHDSYYQREDLILRGDATTQELDGVTSMNLDVSDIVDSEATGLGPHVDIDHTVAVQDLYLSRVKYFVTLR